MAFGRCPRDSSPLETEVAGPGSFSVCKQCHGMLVKAADLEAFLKTPVESWRLPVLEVGKGELAHSDTWARCLCFCGQLMETRKRHGVAIDICKGCGAVWLDGGELVQLLKRHQIPEGPEGPFFDIVMHFLLSLIRY